MENAEYFKNIYFLTKQAREHNESFADWFNTFNWFIEDDINQENFFNGYTTLVQSFRNVAHTKDISGESIESIEEFLKEFFDNIENFLK